MRLLVALLLLPVADAAFRRIPAAAPEAVSDRAGIATLVSVEPDGRGWITHWSMEEPLRGDEGPLTATWSAQQAPTPGSYLLIARSTPTGAEVLDIRTADDSRTRTALELPYGWTFTPSGPTRPFGAFAELPDTSPGLVLTLERPFTAADAKDGHARIILSNPTSSAVVVDALPAAGSTPRWRDGLIFGVGRHVQTLPPCANVAHRGAQGLTLEPGASVDVLVDLHELAFWDKPQNADHTITITLGEHVVTTTLAGRKHKSQHREALARVSTGDCLP